jgi:hypothetical protein
VRPVRGSASAAYAVGWLDIAVTFW